jgi:hypothetical protein
LVVRKAARIVGASVVTLALVACGNGDGDGEGIVSAQTYAQRLCANMQSYIDEWAMLSTDFAGELDPAAELDEQRDALLAFLDDVILATDRLIAGVERAGVPDIDSADEVVAAIEVAFAEARDVLVEARAKAGAISVDDPELFADELNEIGETIQVSLGEIGSSTATIDAPELTAALNDDPVCAAAISGATG